MTRIVLGVERVEQIGQWREHGASMWHDMGITAVKDAREGYTGRHTWETM